MPGRSLTWRRIAVGMVAMAKAMLRRLATAVLGGGKAGQPRRQPAQPRSSPKTRACSACTTTEPRAPPGGTRLPSPCRRLLQPLKPHVRPKGVSPSHSYVTPPPFLSSVAQRGAASRGPSAIDDHTVIWRSMAHQRRAFISTLLLFVTRKARRASRNSRHVTERHAGRRGARVGQHVLTLTRSHTRGQTARPVTKRRRRHGGCFHLTGELQPCIPPFPPAASSRQRCLSHWIISPCGGVFDWPRYRVQNAKEAFFLCPILVLPPPSPSCLVCYLYLRVPFARPPLRSTHGSKPAGTALTCNTQNNKTVTRFVGHSKKKKR